MSTNLEAAGIIARRVQLIEVDLVASSFESWRDPFRFPIAVELETSYRCEYRLETGVDEDHIEVLVHCALRADSVESDDSSKLMNLSASFRLIYLLVDLDSDSSLDEVTERALHYFSNLNGPYNAWPYWREFVQSVAARAGVMGVMIPVFRPLEFEISDDDDEATTPPSPQPNSLPASTPSSPTDPTP